MIFLLMRDYIHEYSKTIQLTGVFLITYYSNPNGIKQGWKSSKMFKEENRLIKYQINGYKQFEEEFTHFFWIKYF